MKTLIKVTLTSVFSFLYLSAIALPTYEPFTEYIPVISSNPTNLVVTTTGGVAANVDSAISNCINLATGGYVAPGGDQWGSLNFSGTQGALYGLDIAVITNSSIFTSVNLAALLPSTFPGFPTSGGIGAVVENPAQPKVFNGTSYVTSNYCGNSAILKFSQPFARPTSGAKTLFVSYLFSVAQQGVLGSGNEGRYMAFVSSTNLAEGTGSGGAYATWNNMFNAFNGGTAAGVHYAAHGIIQQTANSTFYIGPCDSAKGQQFTTSPFNAGFGAPSFIVGAIVLNASAPDTNVVWVNPAISSFGGVTPPASPIFAAQINFTNNSYHMGDIGGLVLIDRVGSGATGGIGTNYVANLIVGTTWSYVTGGPEFTTQPPASTSVNLGQNPSLTANATAAGQAVGYQWQKIAGGVTNSVTNGAGGAGGAATISGANTATLTFTGFSGGDVGTYQLLATAGGTGFSLASSTAALLLADPQVTASPTNTTVNYGGTATFTAQASTTQAPLTFQWFKGTTPLANGLQPDGSTATGATGTTGAGTSFTLTLSLSGVSYQDDGIYTLYVTNNSNFANPGQPATLTVRDPYIATQPANPSVPDGGNATFTVGAFGSPMLTYQWYENGTALTDGNPTVTGTAVVSGAQTATLTLTGVHDADNGSYACTIASTASGQSTNSAAAILTVQDPLTIVASPVSRNQRVGDHTAFVVSVSGGGPAFQWSFNSTPIPGATANALVLTNIQTSANGTYSVQVSNLLTTPQTFAATLNVIDSQVLALARTNIVVARVGDGAQALSVATGNTIFLDQYKPDGTYLNTIQVPDEGTGQPYGTGSSSSASMPSGSPALLVQGAGADAGYEAMLSLSAANQEYIGFAGYCEAYPFAGADVSAAALGGAYWRGLATINAFGIYSLAYTNTGLYSGGNHLIRSMLTLDGTNFWTTGAAGSGTIKFVNSTVTAYALGSGIPSSTGVSANGGRSIQIVNGPLPGFPASSNLVFAETGFGGLNGLYAANGVPEPGTSVNMAFTQLLVTGGQPGDFAFSPDNATVYIADSAVFTGTTDQTSGGIQRWDTNATSGGYSYSYTLTPLIGQTNGAQGLTVDFSAAATWGPGVTGAKLYATTYAPAGNTLVSVIDTGASSASTVLAAAGPNQALRGVRFGPAAIPPAIAGAPQDQTIPQNNNVTFTVSATGSAPLFYQWYFGSTLLAGATQTSFTTNNVTFASSGSYSVVVSNLTSLSVTGAAVLNVTAGAPAIAPLPNFVESAGEHLAWAPVVSGTLPVTNYWYAGSSLIQSNVSPPADGSLVLANIQPGNSGTYTLVASNVYGHASVSAALTVTTGRQTFSSNNLVVVRIGDGAQLLSSATGNTLYLDQYTTVGGYVNTVQIPDEGSGLPYGTGGTASTNLPFGSPALLFPGAGTYAGFDGVLTRSPNAQTLNLAGYVEAYPFAGSDLTVGANGGVNWRGIGGINAYGYYSVLYTNTGLYSGGNHQIHGAVDIDGNGTNFYTTGQAGSGNGIKYCNVNFQPASGGGIAAITATYDGSRVAGIVNGNLFFTDASATPRGLYACGGLPVTTATSTLLIADPGSPIDFAVSPDQATIYISDNGAFTGTGNQAGGIQRYDSNGAGGYNLSYTLPTAVGSTAGTRALTVDFSANTSWGAGVHGAVLYATTAETSGNRLIKIVDNGVASTAATLLTAAPKQMLAGIRFGPAIVPPSFAVEPVNVGTFTNSAATFVSYAVGSGPLTYQWFFQAGGVGTFNPIAGATNASYTIAVATSANIGNYYVMVTNPGNLTAQSQTVSFSLVPSPRFTSQVFLGVGSGLQLTFTGPAGTNYTLWTSTNVTLRPITNTWTQLSSGTFTGGSDTHTDATAGVNPEQYYILSVP